MKTNTEKTAKSVHLSFGLVMMSSGERDDEEFVDGVVKHLRSAGCVLQVMDSSLDRDDEDSPYSICASSMGHVVPISSPLLSRKQLVRALKLAFEYIEELEGAAKKIGEAEKRYRSLVGARKR